MQQDKNSKQIKNDPIVSFNNVTKVYGSGENSVKALNDVSLKINTGEFVAVMGTSGSGKSTAMNILGCLDTCTSGNYLFKGVDVKTLDRDERALLRRNYLGFVFQGFNLLARTTSLENLELPLIYKRIDKEERTKIALSALETVGLQDRGHHTASELSGGQQQRVAIARAIVTKPTLLLADEPTGNLDTSKSIEIMELLVNLNKKNGLTIVLVTHEEEMASFAKRKILFKDGEIISDTFN